MLLLSAIAIVIVGAAVGIGVLLFVHHGSPQPVNIGNAPKPLSDAAVDAAANFIIVMASHDDTPEMGRRYDELASWLNGKKSVTAARLQQDIAMICSAPSARCKAQQSTGAALHTLVGTLDAPACRGGYAISYANVEVRNESGTLIGTGSTGRGVARGAKCEVAFTVPDLPKAAFYQITIGTHTGSAYSYDELQSMSWTVSLSLG